MHDPVIMKVKLFIVYSHTSQPSQIPQDRPEILSKSRCPTDLGWSAGIQSSSSSSRNKFQYWAPFCGGILKVGISAPPPIFNTVIGC